MEILKTVKTIVGTEFYITRKETPKHIPNLEGKYSIACPIKAETEQKTLKTYYVFQVLKQLKFNFTIS